MLFRTLVLFFLLLTIISAICAALGVCSWGMAALFGFIMLALSIAAQLESTFE